MLAEAECYLFLISPNGQQHYFGFREGVAAFQGARLLIDSDRIKQNDGQIA